MEDGVTTGIWEDNEPFSMARLCGGRPARTSNQSPEHEPRRGPDGVAASVQVGCGSRGGAGRHASSSAHVRAVSARAQSTEGETAAPQPARTATGRSHHLGQQGSRAGPTRSGQQPCVTGPAAPGSIPMEGEAPRHLGFLGTLSREHRLCQPKGDGSAATPKSTAVPGSAFLHQVPELTVHLPFTRMPLQARSFWA